MKSVNSSIKNLTKAKKALTGLHSNGSFYPSVCCLGVHVGELVSTDEQQQSLLVGLVFAVCTKSNMAVLCDGLGLLAFVDEAMNSAVCTTMTHKQQVHLRMAKKHCQTGHS